MLSFFSLFQGTGTGLCGIPEPFARLDFELWTRRSFLRQTLRQKGASSAAAAGALRGVGGGGRGMAIGGGERPGSAPQRSPGLIHCSSQLWLRDTLVGNLLYSKLIGIPVRPHRACPRCRALASVETWVETRRLGSSDGHSPEICRVGAVCGSIPFLEWGVEDSGSSARPAKSDTNTTSPLG